MPQQKPIRDDIDPREHDDRNRNRKEEERKESDDAPEGSRKKPRRDPND
jgi:hypothetical protein